MTMEATETRLGPLAPGSGAITVLDKLHIDIVHGCQLRCLGCPNSTLQPKVKRISVEDFDRILRNIDVDHIHMLRRFNFGEPLLHHDLPGILSKIPGQRWRADRIEISTNAQFVDWPSFEEALGLGVLTQLVVSCDGDGTPEEYERLRPPSRWSKFIEFLERTRELRDRLCPSMQLYTRTICEDPGAQARWSQVLGSRGWTPEFRGWGYLPEATENMTGRELRIPNGLCGFMRTSHRLYVDWGGTVVPCCVHPRASVLGSLREKSFNEILRDRARANFMARMEDDRKSMRIYNTCVF
jgi:MoaA/NifB/PqqE/SkfB family radical SAM enzyme